MNMRIKKAQGLSLQTIILAVLAIIVLIVLIVIFVSKSSLFTDNIDNCKDKLKDAECVSDITDCGPLRYGTFGCKEGAFCCVTGEP